MQTWQMRAIGNVYQNEKKKDLNVSINGKTTDIIDTIQNNSIHNKLQTPINKYF